MPVVAAWSCVPVMVLYACNGSMVMHVSGRKKYQEFKAILRYMEFEVAWATKHSCLQKKKKDYSWFAGIDYRTVKQLPLTIVANDHK